MSDHVLAYLRGTTPVHGETKYYIMLMRTEGSRAIGLLLRRTPSDKSTGEKVG